MTDFFISYTHKDQTWAEWIAYVLEEEGFSTVIQAWDFRPGSNFVLEMQQAAASADRTIIVLSPDYLGSKMAAPEWAAAFSQDPQGLQRRLLPVMVRECDPKGLLPNLVQIRVSGLDEAAARTALTTGVKNTRAKPSRRPAYPGAAPPSTGHGDFPGPDQHRADDARPPNATRVLPQLNQRPTDAERRRFAKDGFKVIRDMFQSRLTQAEKEDTRVETDFTETSAVEFRAELFVDGKSKADCRIWLGDAFGPNGICYSAGRSTGNSFNEALSVTDDGPLGFSAMMTMGHSEFEKGADMKRLTPQQAAEYYWSRFVASLRHR